jgi:hypothetical protein
VAAIKPLSAVTDVKLTGYGTRFLARTLLINIDNRDSLVGIALGYGLDDWGSRVRFPARAGNFFLHHRVQNGSGAHPPPTQWIPGTVSLGVKRPGREDNHSPPCSAEVEE